MAQDSQLWAKLIAALSGDTYVAPLKQAEDPKSKLSPIDLLYKKRRADEILRRQRLGREPIEGPTWPDQMPISPDLSPAIDSNPFERTPMPGDINVEQLSSYEFPVEGEPLGRSTDKIDLPQQATADDGSYPYDYDPAEYLRNYASGIDQEKLARIRAQAAMKGNARSLSGRGGTMEEEDARTAQNMDGPNPIRGSFSQQEMSPEIEMRLAARDRWKEGQPMRDQEYLASPEMARRNPELAAAAGKTLTDMQSNKAVERQQQLQNSLADKLGGGSGVIPFEQAMKLRLSGVQIPPQIMGMSPDEASSRMEAMLNYQNRSLSNIDPMEAIADPIKGVDLKNNRLAMSIIQDANTRIQQGENRDAVYKELMDDLMQLSSINISQKQKIAAEIQSQLAKSPTSDK